MRHVLRFEVGAETLAAFREAVKAVRKRSDHRLNEDEALLSMAREILGGPRDSGRASYQIVVTQCEDCGRGFQHANGELIELDPAIVEMCHCDAQNVPVARQHGVPEGHAETFPLSARPSRDGNSEEAAKAHAHMGDADERAHGDVAVTRSGELAKADVRLGREAGVAPVGLKRRRATQDTPPAIRREVFLRDRGRCIVPGCRNAAYVDLHHLELRSEGGGNDPDNLVVLCGAHHGALHRGRLRIDGKVSTGLRIRHADGTVYGFMPSTLLAEASASAFAALRNLSFPEKTARAALERALATAPANASKETLLRAALAHATSHAAKPGVMTDAPHGFRIELPVSESGGRPERIEEPQNGPARRSGGSAGTSALAEGVDAEAKGAAHPAASTAARANCTSLRAFSSVVPRPRAMDE